VNRRTGKALEFARYHHRAQVRKYTREPYVNHLIEVAELVTRYGVKDAVVAAALLHDILEDTNVTAEELGKEFGPRILTLVLEVTELSKPEDGNRARRKEIDRLHFSKASPEGQTIKLADLWSNSVSILAHDPSFAKVFFREATLMLEVLDEGNPILRDELGEFLQENSQLLLN
jgi:(p)ppGpp synthase/HD superfamily hydrolase